MRDDTFHTQAQVQDVVPIVGVCMKERCFRCVEKSEDRLLYRRTKYTPDRPLLPGWAMSIIDYDLMNDLIDYIWFDPTRPPFPVTRDDHAQIVLTPSAKGTDVTVTFPLASRAIGKAIRRHLCGIDESLARHRSRWNEHLFDDRLRCKYILYSLPRFVIALTDPVGLVVVVIGIFIWFVTQ
jgi:hypothetical protein